MEQVCKKIKEDYGIVWRSTYIDKVFNNPFYYGQMRVKNNLYPHRYHPIISKDLFDEVQKVKSGFNKKRFKYAGLPFPLPWSYSLRSMWIGNLP
jgi:hypothetical protein